MAETIEVELPNGAILTDVPVNASQNQVMNKAIQLGLAQPSDFAATGIPGTEPPPSPPREKSIMEQFQPYLESAMQGAAAVPVMAGVGRAGQALFSGSRAAPYAREFARAVIPQSGKGLLAEGGLGAVSGVAAQYAGEQFPEGTQREVASTVAGIGAAYPFSLAKNVATVALNKGLGRESANMLSESSETLGKMRAHAQAKTAIESNPNLIPDVLRANEIEGMTGIDLPTLARSNGDTTISGYLQGQMERAENAEFIASIKQQYEAAEQQLKTFRNGVAPTMAEVDDLVRTRAARMKASNEQIMRSTKERIESRQQTINMMTDKIQEASSLTNVEGKTDIGERLTNLIKSKEATIRSTLSPQYDKLIESATQAGIKLPGESAKALADYARDEMNADVFSKFPSLFSDIKRVFKPKSAAVSKEMSAKYKFAKQPVDVAYRDIPLNQLDSLKRNVNKAIRDSSDPNQLRILGELKTQVNKAIDTVDPSFSDPYRALDIEYAKQLGIPFSENGVVQVNRAKFVENAVNSMTKTASGLKQVLGVIGDNPKGRQVVEDAFLYDIMNNRSIINTNTGEVNPAQLRRYMAANKEKFDLIPDVKAKLEQTMKSTENMINSRNMLIQRNKEDVELYVKDVLGEAYSANGGLYGTVQKAMTNPEQMDVLLSRINNDKTAQDAVKGALLDNLMGISAANRMNVFESPPVSVATAKVFKGSFEPIRALLEASVRLEQNPFKYNIRTGQSKTMFEKATGSKAEQTAGELRNQVLSAHRVLINHVSRFFQNKSTRAEAEAVKEFLLDSKALQKAAEMEREFDDNGVSDKFVSLGKQVFKNSTTTWLQGGLVGYMTGELNDEPYQPYTPSQPWMAQ